MHPLRLIVITDESLAGGANGVVRTVGEAVAAGCRAVQLRMKGASAREMTAIGRTLRAVTRRSEALFLINDRADVALATAADGVHLGPEDLSVEAARAILGAHALVGYSADDPETARKAEAAGASYIGCGTVYATSSKSDAGEVIGTDGLQRVVRAVDIPVVAVGGITPERADAVFAAGAAGVAVISAVMGAPEPDAVVRRLLASGRADPAAGSR